MKLTLDHFVERRGSALLLAHCAATGPSPVRVPAHARLEQELGGDLTRRLMRALATRQSRPDDVVA